jgi:hypothetical protein
MSGGRADPVITRIARELRVRLGDGALSPQAVEALDVVTHALVFAHHPRALDLWRKAVRSGVITAETREAMHHMLLYAREAVMNGQPERVAAICDCIHTVLDSSANDPGATVCDQPTRRVTWR